MKAFIKKTAFTLIELCVVMALIIILTTVISKTRSKIKEKSLELRDRTQLKSIVEAVKNFEQDFGILPTNLAILTNASKIRAFAAILGFRVLDKYTPYLAVENTASIFVLIDSYTSCPDGSLFDKDNHYYNSNYSSTSIGKRCCDKNSKYTCTKIIEYLSESYSVDEGTAGAIEKNIPADSHGNIIYYFAYPKEYTYYPDPENPDPATAESKGNWFAIIMSGPDGECSFDDEFASGSYTLSNLFLSSKPMGNREYAIVKTLNYDKNDPRNKDNIVYFSDNCPFN